MPVPSVSSAASRAPTAAPKRHSASIAALASLSTNTGSPSRSAMTSRNGRSASGRLTAMTAMPRSWSMRHGIPMPTASTVPDAPSIASRTSRDRADDRVEHARLVGSARRAGRPMMDVQCRVDRAGQELRATEVDPDHAAGRHDRPPYRAACRHPRTPRRQRREYRVYRSRKALLPRRERRRRRRARPAARRRAAAGAGARPRKGISGGPRRALDPRARSPCWIALSVVVFLVSAQIQQGKIGDEANALLGGAGYPLWSPNNVLVLGSDQRTDGHARARRPDAAAAASDSIMLMRVGGGANSRLSIARDTVVDIPGHGRDKINAAFAFGGTALAIQTVEAVHGRRRQPRRRRELRGLPRRSSTRWAASRTAAAASSRASTAAFATAATRCA